MRSNWRARGAKVVVNDLGGAVDGTGGNSQAAEAVVAEIKAAGGTAIANGASVTDDAGVAHLVKQTMDAFGRIDVLIANAGILRDKSFCQDGDEGFRRSDGRASDGHGEARARRCGRSCATSNMAASS